MSKLNINLCRNILRVCNIINPELTRTDYVFWRDKINHTLEMMHEQAIEPDCVINNIVMDRLMSHDGGHGDKPMTIYETFEIASNIIHKYD